jgi:hypothetical protein
MAFQMRAIPKERLKTRIRALSVEELAELELATDEAVGRVEPETGCNIGDARPNRRMEPTRR